MKVVIDIEANSLSRPTNIWLIVCKDIDTNELFVFRNLTLDKEQRDAFLSFASQVDLWIGHNLLGYDYPVLRDLISPTVIPSIHNCLDTLIISKLVNYSRPSGHSLESYGEEYDLVKLPHSSHSFFSQWSQELEDYCVRDVNINHLVYNHYLPIINNPEWLDSISLEQDFQLICNDLHDTGFYFNSKRANLLLSKVTADLAILDEQILAAFPPKEVLIREFTPKLTKFGTISRTSVPRQLHSLIHTYECGQVYRHTRLVTFNPASHKQLLEVLNAAGWKPEDKTQTHIETEREVNRSKKNGVPSPLLDKLNKLKITGWKVNENNLNTLPSTAPEPSRLLAKRILLESRRRSLREWLDLVQDDGRIHGKFLGIGAWTHRMAHQQPNTANIPRAEKEDGTSKLLGKELRELWCAPKNKLLVGVDAEGIQLRIFAHYINDQEFTDALVRGKKSTKTDPHSLNQRVLGNVCKSRQAAKRFIYALLLGAGIGKLVQILEASKNETQRALDRLMGRYQGWAYLKEHVFPIDAKRGWFLGLDGRHVILPGDTQRDREHLCMSGYLQNGEAIIIKRAAVTTSQTCKKDNLPWEFVNIVHDELQSETNNSMDIAVKVATIKADAIRQAGEYYKLKCPMAGSFWSEERNDYTIGTTWFKTH